LRGADPIVVDISNDLSFDVYLAALYAERRRLKYERDLTDKEKEKILAEVMARLDSGECEHDLMTEYSQLYADTT
jgi:hypothetical protein